MKYVNKLTSKFFSLDTPPSRYAVRLKRKYRIKKFYQEKHKTIEVGGGKTPPYKGALNVDLLDYHTVDIIADLLLGLPFLNDELDKIVSVATLEHFNIPSINKILKEFYRVLRPGGELEVSVPSLKKAFAHYNNFGCDDILLRYLHGAQKDEYDIHLAVLDFERLRSLLEDAGFSNITEVDYDYALHDKELMMKILARK
jgi:predicted SAM-dependent methyltransferase